MVKNRKKKDMAKMARTAKIVKSDILKNARTEQNGGSNSPELKEDQRVPVPFHS